MGYLNLVEDEKENIYDKKDVNAINGDEIIRESETLLKKKGIWMLKSKLRDAIGRLEEARTYYRKCKNIAYKYQMARSYILTGEIYERLDDKFNAGIAYESGVIIYKECINDKIPDLLGEICEEKKRIYVKKIIKYICKIIENLIYDKKYEERMIVIMRKGYDFILYKGGYEEVENYVKELGKIIENDKNKELFEELTRIRIIIKKLKMELMI
jgi:hypothetical protein